MYDASFGWKSPNDFIPRIDFQYLITALATPEVSVHHGSLGFIIKEVIDFSQEFNLVGGTN